MNNTTNKNRIITILRRFESGLTYKDLLKQYKTDFNIELVNGYVYLKRLKKDGLIENYKTPNSIGKILTYKLIPKNNNTTENGTVERLKGENERLKKYLKFYDGMFKDNIDYLMENETIDKYIEENEEKFDNIELVINNA